MLRDVILIVRGMRSVQPSDEVRKVDHRIMWYRRLVRDGDSFRRVESPISPSAFKGALRQVACTIVTHDPSLRDAYLSLFGRDVWIGRNAVHRCPGIDPSAEVDGKLVVELVDVRALDGERELAKAVEVRPRVRIDAETGSVSKGALVFSEAISSRLEVRFRLSSTSDLTEDERRLLEASLRALMGWGIGGWASVGFGIVEGVRVEEVSS